MSKTSTDWFSRPLASFISISFVVAYLLGGFVGGFFMCTSCATFDIEGRLVVSLLIGILSIVFGGFPPANEGGGRARSEYLAIYLGLLGMY